MKVPKWLTWSLWLQDGPWQPQDQALLQLTERDAQQAATLQPGAGAAEWTLRLFRGLKNLVQELKAVCADTPAPRLLWPKLNIWN